MCIPWRLRAQENAGTLDLSLSAEFPSAKFQRGLAKQVNMTPKNMLQQLRNGIAHWALRHASLKESTNPLTGSLGPTAKRVCFSPRDRPYGSNVNSRRGSLVDVAPGARLGQASGGPGLGTLPRVLVLYLCLRVGASSLMDTIRPLGDRSRIAHRAILYCTCRLHLIYRQVECKWETRKLTE